MPWYEIALRIGGTILALVLLLVLAWLLLRWMNGRVPGLGSGNGRIIRVIDRVAVGRNSQILLLKVKDKVLLVAVSDNAAAKLCEWGDAGDDFAPAAPGGEGGFSSALKDATRKFGFGPKDGGELP